jgi:hypothetical protein
MDQPSHRPCLPTIPHRLSPLKNIFTAESAETAEMQGKSKKQESKRKMPTEKIFGFRCVILVLDI